MNAQKKIFLIFWLFFAGFLRPVLAMPEEQVWEFELEKPGDYHLVVTHVIENDKLRQELQGHYTVYTDDGLYERSVYLIVAGSGQPFRPVTAPIKRPQRVLVHIWGLPKSVLQTTEVNLSIVKVRENVTRQYPDTLTREFEDIRVIGDILSLPEHKIDLARTKLTLDKLIDPNIDVEASMTTLRGMVSTIETMLPLFPSNQDKLQALRQYLYQPGPWNDYVAYQYDFDDPMGTKIANKLLPNYMASKKGNCISMPFLFIALGEMLGLDITASTAPLHVFVKYTDEKTGQSVNLETTSGANPSRDVWYQQTMPMTDMAIENGIYLQHLTKKETVAVMAATLSEHYAHIGEYKKVIALSNLTLKYYPKQIGAILRKGSAYFKLLEMQFLSKYPRPHKIPVQQRGYYEHLSRNNILWFKRAEALGWREPDKGYDERYLQMVKRDAVK